MNELSLDIYFIKPYGVQVNRTNAMTINQKKRLKIIDTLLSSGVPSKNVIEWAYSVNNNYELGIEELISLTLYRAKAPAPPGCKPKLAYVSGGISGLRFTSAELRFDDACGFLHSIGVRSLNPLKIAPLGLTWKEYMQIDLRALRLCDSIYMMKGWHKSRGARIEHWFAKRIGLNVYYQN